MINKTILILYVVVKIKFV